MWQGLDVIHISNFGKRWLFLYSICQWHSVSILVPDKPARQIWPSVQTTVKDCIANNDNVVILLLLLLIVIIIINHYPTLQGEETKTERDYSFPEVSTLARFPNPFTMLLSNSLWLGDFWVGILKKEFTKNKSKQAVQKTTRNFNIGRLSFNGFSDLLLMGADRTFWTWEEGSLGWETPFPVFLFF